MKRYIFASTAGAIDVFKLDTDTSYYNNFLNAEDLAYMQKSKNRTGEVVYMTPKQYYEECATKIFRDTSVESLKQQRWNNGYFVEQYRDDMLAGDKFPLCFLNYADSSQEGLHRMMAAGEAFGWDTKFPVLVVNVVDQHLEDLHDIWRDYVNAVGDAEEYRYDEETWEQDFVEEVKYNLEHRTGKHYDVVIVGRRSKEECEKYNMDYAIEIALAEFQDIMSPTTVFEPTFRDAQTYDSELEDLDDDDFDDLDDDVFI